MSASALQGGQKSGIAVAHGRFIRICHMAPIFTHIYLTRPSLGPPESIPPTTSRFSAVFPGLTIVTDRSTDHNLLSL